MDEAAVAEAFTPAARDALKAFPIEPAEITLVSMSENVTLKVIDARDGDAYVLRLHRPWYHTLEELNSEHVWTRALDVAGIAVPAPVATLDGRDYVQVAIASTGERRYAGMARWITGELLAEVMQRPAETAAIERHFEQLGSTMASMHNQSTDWRPPATFKRHALDADGLMGDAPFWGRFWEHPILSEAERKLLLATRARIHALLTAYGKDPATYSMIHADLHPANVLVDGGRLAVIDFDDAAFGWHQYDLAVAFIQYQSHPDFPAFQRACIAGYRAVREIADEALALIPMFLLARGMAQIGWFHQRPEINRPEVFKAMKDVVCAQCEAFQPA